MRPIIALLWLSSLLSSVDSAAEPATGPKDVAAIENRNPVSVIITAVRLGTFIADIVTDILDDIEDMEEEFVKKTLGSLRAHFKPQNVLIFHNQKSKFVTPKDEPSMHKHVEIDLIKIFGTTKGYEIHVFKRGTFTLAGDRGWRNWGYSGSCTKRTEKNGDPAQVVFAYPGDKDCKSESESPIPSRTTTTRPATTTTVPRTTTTAPRPTTTTTARPTTTTAAPTPRTTTTVARPSTVVGVPPPVATTPNSPSTFDTSVPSPSTSAPTSQPATNAPASIPTTSVRSECSRQRQGHAWLSVLMLLGLGLVLI